MAMELKEKIRNAPLEPGCYLFKDARGEVIYVGKAKILRNRVKQYFMKTNQQEDKGLILGKMICDVEFKLTSTERDALLTEYQLIKYYRPWFNIQHKNDRLVTYYLKLNHIGAYPSFEIVDHWSGPARDCLGEFRSEGRAKEAISILNRIFKTPVCGRDFREKKEPCLHYQLGQCMGPCGLKIDQAEYEKVLKEIRNFFSGKQSRILNRLNREMKECVSNLEFEKAAQLKRDMEDLRQLVRRFHSRMEIPQNKEVLLFLRAYREEGFSVFYIHSGNVLERCDFEHTLEDDRLREFLSEHIRQVPETTKDCLQNVYADKLLIILPSKKDLEKRVDAVKKGAFEWLQ